MAGFAGFLNPKIKKYKPSKMDLLAAAIMSTVANGAAGIVKDTAVSGGQILNESVNQNGAGLGPFFQPAAMLLKQYGGQDALAKLVGRFNSDAGRSMRGEVTPMDVVNVASFAPIPAGAGVRAGLIGLRMGTKALPRILKGGKYVASTNIPIQPSVAARIVERTIASPFSEAIGEGALNAPAVPQIWNNDSLDTKSKVGLTAAIISGVLGPSAARGIGKATTLSRRVKLANDRIANGAATEVDYAISNTSKVKSGQSDLTLSMDTGMPEEAIAALTIGQSGNALPLSIRLYETDAEFKTIIDDLSSGRTTAAQATKDYNDWKTRVPAGSRAPFIPTRSFAQIENYAKTGRLSKRSTSIVDKATGTADPLKTDRFALSLKLSPVKGSVGDTRELQLYDALVQAGEIKGVKVGKTNLFKDHVSDVQARNPNYKLADTINSRAARQAMREVDDWIMRTYGVTSPARMSAIRERLYQGIGHSGSGLTGLIF